MTLIGIFITLWGELWWQVRPRLPEQFKIYHLKVPGARRSLGFYVRGNWYHELEPPGGNVLYVRRRGAALPRELDRLITVRRDPYWRTSLSWPTRKEGTDGR